ncbi:MAG: aspartate-semialdehyde dehydrogenase [Chlamydiia bacterium]|nr:aspartate-semialdehyde dehydrogenase [Chlamydiia bacterium]
MTKIPVGILGATGTVGQRFYQLLDCHPWFEPVFLAASEKSAGKPYKEAVKWLMDTPLTPEMESKPVYTCYDEKAPKLLFSALDSSCALEVESYWASKGHKVISNAKNHRMDPDVALIVPEVNGDQLSSYSTNIVTNPNCSIIALSMALKPLHERFGVLRAHVVTMQAISGAGYPGVSSMEILDNIIPHIPDEEEKMEEEIVKILGTKDKPASITLSAQCNRVPVFDGHTECVSVEFRIKPTLAQLKEAFHELKPLNLPTAPEKPLWIHDDPFSPQPRRHRNLDKGMAVHIGQIQPCPVLDYKFTLMGHNTLRGAAGGSLLIAELMHQDFWSAEPWLRSGRGDLAPRPE